MKFNPAAHAIKDILFLDVETVAQYPTLNEAPEPYQRLWERKAARFMDEGDTPESIYSKSAIFSEFGRILAISMGYFHESSEGGDALRITTLIGDERALLFEFRRRLASFNERHPNINFCAYNGKEFDFPYIARRLLIQGITIPPSLYVAGRKPWETNFLDTFELWKFGDYKHYTSIHLLGYIFGVSELMEDMEGSMLHALYYTNGDLTKIAEYSQRKLATCAQLYRRFITLPALPKERLEYNEARRCEAGEEALDTIEPISTESSIDGLANIPIITSDTPLDIAISVPSEV